MESFCIEGGIPLSGEVTPSGNKNAALPLLCAAILTDEPVKCDFKAIYRGEGPEETADAKLSEKDFVALAIAGARTPQSFALSGRRAALSKDLQEKKITREEYDAKLFQLNDAFSTEDQCLRKSEDYTFSKVNLPYCPDVFCKEYFPCVQNGRKMASHAMEEYEKNNLKPLAKLIAFGITEMTATNRKEDANVYQASVAEMCKRMSNMLERDPDLKKEAFKQGLRQQDLNMIDSFTMQNKIRLKSDYGLTLWQKRPDLVTGDVKLNIMADMYIDRIMSGEYRNLAHNVLEKQPSCANAFTAANQAVQDASDAGNMKKARILERKANHVLSVETMKLRYRDKFAENIVKPGAYEKLRRKVLKMLSETELQNMSEYEYATALSRLVALKLDTGMTTTLSYLQNYKNQPKTDDGLYKMQVFHAFQGKAYETAAGAHKARIEEEAKAAREKQQAVAEPNAAVQKEQAGSGLEKK